MAYKWETKNVENNNAYKWETKNVEPVQPKSVEPVQPKSVMFTPPKNNIFVDAPKSVSTLPLSRKQLNTSSITKDVDNTPLPKKGFWENLRNNEDKITNNPVFKAITAIPNKAYETPLTQRFFTTLGNTIGGEGTVKNNDGSAMQKMDAGKIGNTIADIAGTGAAYGIKLPGMNNSVQGSIDRVLNPIEANVLSRLPNMPKAGLKAIEYGTNAVKSGLDMGVGNVIQGVAQGQSKEDIAKGGLNGLWQGALFGTALKGAGDIGKSAFPKWETTHESIKPIETPKPIKEVAVSKPLEPLKVMNESTGINPSTTNNTNIDMKSNLNIPIDTEGKSKFVWNSVQNSEVAPKAMKDTIEAPPYIKVNNQDTWTNAVKTVEDNPQTALKDYFNSKDLKSADDTALGQALIVKAIKEGRIDDANEISIDLAEKLSRAGQTVQAASIFKRLSPEGMLQYANNVVNRVNKVIEKEKGIKSSIKKVKLSTEETKKILEGMKEYQGMADGDAKDIKLAQIMQIINNKQPSNLVDKIRAVRNIALLGNAKTNVRNVVGNTIMGATDNASNVLGAGIDKIVARKTGQRSEALPNLGIQAKGMWKGTKKAIQDSFGGIKLSDLKGKTLKEKAKILSDAFANPIDRQLNGNGKFETGNRLAFDNKPMRIAENAIGTALKVGDNSFKTAYYDDVLNQLMKSNKVDVATDEMKQIAEQIANERTYQDNNSLTKLAMGVKNLPQKLENGKLKDATQIFVDSQLPYVKTPANLLKRAIEYTPVGLADGGLKLNKMLKNGAETGAYDMAKQREAVDRISRGIVGTGIMGLGALGASQGLLTGSKAKDKDMAAFDQQNGKQPYAIKVGDKYYNYDWAQPMSMPLSGGVQMVQGKKGQPVNNALDAVSNALTFYSEQPMLQSIQKLVGSPYDSKSIGQRALEAGLQLPNQFVPTALKQVTQMTDSNVRSNYSPNLFEKTVINPIKSKIPGLSNTLPTKIDTLGNEVKQYQGNNNLFNVALNPGNLTTKKNDKTIQMIEDIYNKTGSAIQVPRVASNTITYTDSKTKKSSTIDLTGTEVQELQKYIGDKTAQEYSKLANSYNTSSNSDEANRKAKQLQSLLTKIYDAGKLKVLQNRGLHEYKK